MSLFESFFPHKKGLNIKIIFFKVTVDIKRIAIPSTTHWLVKFR